MKAQFELDEDVAALLEKAKSANGDSLQRIVNEALRVGLERYSPSQAVSTNQCRFTVRTFDSKPRISNIDNVAEILAEFEGEDHL